jgi:NADPH:quinone reductase-like Zn-dependent oxidoreductase
VELLGHIDAARQPIAHAVHELTGGKGADVAFDGVGGEWFEPVLSALADLGRQVVIASIGSRRVGFDLRDFYHRRLTIMGVDSRALTVTACAKFLNSMASLFLDGRLRPAKIARRGSLSDGRELYAYVSKGEGGKAVFTFE